jgi:acyl-CoA thioester hydrolase
VARKIFLWKYRVGYAECTIGDHVYYSRYLDILERARGEFFREIGVTFQAWQHRGFLFPVIGVRARYLAPARYDDELEIKLWIGEAKGIRLNFAGEILKAGAGTTLLRATTEHVCATPDEKPVRLPAELIGLITPYLIKTEKDAE